MVSLFNGISTLFRLFNAKAILLEEQYYLTHSWDDKGVHTFPKGICPKVNIIARLGYEFAYYDSAVHRFNYYTTRTPPYSYEIEISETSLLCAEKWVQARLKMLLEMCLKIAYLIYVCIERFGIKWLQCYKTKPNQIKHLSFCFPISTAWIKYHLPNYFI